MMAQCQGCSLNLDSHLCVEFACLPCLVVFLQVIWFLSQFKKHALFPDWCFQIAPQCIVKVFMYVCVYAWSCKKVKVLSRVPLPYHNDRWHEVMCSCSHPLFMLMDRTDWWMEIHKFMMFFCYHGFVSQAVPRQNCSLGWWKTSSNPITGFLYFSESRMLTGFIRHLLLMIA